MTFDYAVRRTLVLTGRFFEFGRSLANYSLLPSLPINAWVSDSDKPPVRSLAL